MEEEGDFFEGKLEQIARTLGNFESGRVKYGSVKKVFFL